MNFLAKWALQVDGFTPSEGTLRIEDAEDCCDAAMKACRQLEDTAAMLQWTAGTPTPRIRGFKLFVQPIDETPASGQTMEVNAKV